VKKVDAVRLPTTGTAPKAEQWHVFETANRLSKATPPFPIIRPVQHRDERHHQHLVQRIQRPTRNTGIGHPAKVSLHRLDNIRFRAHRSASKKQPPDTASSHKTASFGHAVLQNSFLGNVLRLRFGAIALPVSHGRTQRLGDRTSHLCVRPTRDPELIALGLPAC
jgi:hypothetical protein